MTEENEMTDKATSAAGGGGTEMIGGKKAAEAILAGVNRWSAEGKTNRGICQFMTGEAELALRDLFRYWPESTGNRDYPIPGRFAGDLTKEEAFIQVTRYPGKFLEYEKARIRLAEFLVEECYKELRKNDLD